jgi:hypothetical protein
LLGMRKISNPTETRAAPKNKKMDLRSNAVLVILLCFIGTDVSMFSSPLSNKVKLIEF